MNKALPVTESTPRIDNNAHGVVTRPDTVRIERLMPGPIERLWRYLTESEQRGTWLASGAIDLKVGGKVEFTFNNSSLTGHDGTPPAKYAKYCDGARMHGRVTACDPPTLLSYTWNEDGDKYSEVRFELTPIGSDVLLVVIHSRLGSRDGMVSVAGGWHAHLGILADRLTGRIPAGFWITHTRLEAEYEEIIPGR